MAENGVSSGGVCTCTYCFETSFPNVQQLVSAVERIVSSPPSGRDGALQKRREPRS